MAYLASEVPASQSFPRVHGSASTQRWERGSKDQLAFAIDLLDSMLFRRGYQAVLHPTEDADGRLLNVRGEQL